MKSTYSTKAIFASAFLALITFAATANAQDLNGGVRTASGYSGFGSGPIVFSIMDAARLERPIRDTERGAPQNGEQVIAAQVKVAPATSRPETSGVSLAAAHTDARSGGTQKVVALAQ